MPNLKIDCCEDCPFSKITNREGLDDSYDVTCTHEEQEVKEYFTHKMKFSNSIYFNCPLEKNNHGV